MLATEVHETIYLNVTKLRAVTVLPPGPRHIFPGFEADGQPVPADRQGVGGPRKTVLKQNFGL